MTRCTTRAISAGTSPRHPEITVSNVQEYHGNTWVDCAGGEASVHRFRVNQYFAPGLDGPTHMLVCEVCGLHLHADFEIV
jgi:hypothetical protein